MVYSQSNSCTFLMHHTTIGGDFFHISDVAKKQHASAFPADTYCFYIRYLLVCLFILPVLRMQQHMRLMGHRLSKEIAVDLPDIRVFMRMPEF